MIQCIIVDDEPKAIDILKGYISNIPFLTLLKTFRDPLEALNFITQNRVDLVLLDINMPHLSGIQFAKLVDKKVLFIFTTAYSEHALEGYELDITDYLLKPILFERFLKAATKASETKALKDKASAYTASSEQSPPNYIFLKSGTTIYKVDFANILYLAKEGNYFEVYMTYNKKLLIRINFTDIADLLPKEQFYRIHKSYIINIRHIELIETDSILINKVNIPIGNTYKEAFMEMIKTR